MNKVGETATVIAAGALTFVGASKEINLLSSANMNPKVKACAAHLGNIATTSPKLPPGCQSIKTTFGYHQTTTYIYKPNQDSYSSQEDGPKIYDIPSSADFLDENLENASQTQRTELGELGMAATAGLAMSGLLFWMFRQRRKNIVNTPLESA